MMRIDRLGKKLTKAIAFALSFSMIFGQTICAHADEINTATTLYNEGIELVETAENTVSGADFDTIAEADTTDTDSEITAYDNAVNDLQIATESAKDNASTANTSDSKDEAYAAKDNAESSLTEAQTKLNESVTALQNAETAYAEADEAQKAAEAAYEAQKAAEAAYEAAEKALNDTTADTAAARKALEDAKQAIEVQEAKKDALEKIEAQYYGELLYFFYLNVGENNIVFDDNGRLDIKKTVDKMTEVQINSAGNKGDEYLYRFGRKLTKELVEYMILNGDNVDPEKAEFTFGTTGNEGFKKAQEAVVFTNANAHDMVVNKEPDDSKKDINLNPVYGGAVEEYRWGSTNYNNGRGNHVEVTYKDKDGNLHVEYYNYVRKDINKLDDPDFVNGNLYLAIITQDEDGKWVPARVQDENNYDDYTKLTEALKALNQIEDYNQAKADVEAALARVAALESTLATLTESATATKANLELVRSALDLAKDDLEAAEANKENLQASYEEAKAAVESIDLSRFDIVVVPAPVTSAAPATTTAPATAPAAETPAVTTIVSEEAPLAAAPVVTATPVAPTVPAVVADDDDEAAVVEIDEDETPLEEGLTTETVSEVVTDDSEEIDEAELIADIDNETTPLASFSLTESLGKIWWIWIVIAAAIAFTIFFIYKKNSEDEETEIN